MIWAVLGYIFANILLTFVFMVEENATISGVKDFIVLLICGFIPICTIILIYKYIKE